MVRICNLLANYKTGGKEQLQSGEERVVKAAALPNPGKVSLKQLAL